MSSTSSSTYITPFATTGEVIITARLLQTLFLRSLDCSLLQYIVTDFDFYFVGGPQELYGIKPGLAHGLWYSIQRLGRIILCAAHGYTPGASKGALPHYIPDKAMEELQMSFPTVVLAEIYADHNPLLAAQPLHSLKVAIATLQCVGRHGVNWISEAVRQSARNGGKSHWKWGAMVELTDAHPSNFGPFADRVITEIELIRQKELAGEFYFDGEDDGEAEERPGHFEPSVIDNLRQFLVSHHSVFAQQKRKEVNSELKANGFVKPTELDELVEILDGLGLTDISGVPLPGWMDEETD
jgi:hypothetical protein